MSHPTLEDAHTEHHIVGPKIYGLILLVLLCLTALTTGIAFINLGVFSPIVALAIAVSVWLRLGIGITRAQHFRFRVRGAHRERISVGIRFG